MSEESTETSILDALPLPKLEAYYEAPKNRYWIKNRQDDWSPRVAGDVKLELERLGYCTKAPKGKSYSTADYELGDIRNEHGVVFVGEVAGKQPGLHDCGGIRYLVTKGPELVVPEEGNWSTIEKLGLRLFKKEQWQFVLGWSSVAASSLYNGGSGRSQMLVLAGPAGCGKSFWQNRVINGILGGRSANPMQYMSGSTSFNEDVIRAEHLMMEDQHSQTDIRSRRKFGTAIKEYTVNSSQRAHAKGRDAVSIDSRHWVTLSINDEAENLSILPPMDDSILDKIALIKCFPAINAEWPGMGKNEELEQAIRQETPAFLFYLLNQHKIATEDRDERFGIASMHHADILLSLAALSPEETLEVIIDRQWEQLCKEKGKLTCPAEDIELTLQTGEFGFKAKAILTWGGACGVYLERLSRRNPLKYIKPKYGERPRKWTIDWSVPN